MNLAAQVIAALIRASAFRAMRNAPVGVAILILVLAFLAGIIAR